MECETKHFISTNARALRAEKSEQDLMWSARYAFDLDRIRCERMVWGGKRDNINMLSNAGRCAHNLFIVHEAQRKIHFREAQCDNDLRRSNDKINNKCLVGSSVRWIKPHMLSFTDSSFPFAFRTFCLFFARICFWSGASATPLCLSSRFRVAINQQGMHWMRMQCHSNAARVKFHVSRHFSHWIVILIIMPYLRVVAFHFGLSLRDALESLLARERARIPIIYGESVRMNGIESQIQTALACSLAHQYSEGNRSTFPATGRQADAQDETTSQHSQIHNVAKVNNAKDKSFLEKCIGALCIVLPSVQQCIRRVCMSMLCAR